MTALGGQTGPESGVDPRRLAQLLAERLREIVPDGFFVDAEGDTIWYSAESGRFPGQQGLYQVGMCGTHLVENFYLHGATLEEHIVGGTMQALDELQDFVDEASHDPWPGVRRPPRSMPRYVARCCIAGTRTETRSWRSADQSHLSMGRDRTRSRDRRPMLRRPIRSTFAQIRAISPLAVTRRRFWLDDRIGVRC
jgi:hypothetical protein